jgi:hypothetical protein
VLLSLFRGNGSAIAALGTEVGPICVTELWLLSGSGRITPAQAPPDPHIRDFFASDRSIPSDLTASFPFCVRPEGLEVQPLFWTPTGLAHIQVDHAVFYVWNGARFSKRVVPLKIP